MQKLAGNVKRRPPKPENGDKNIFCDLLYCADCGKKLWYHTNTNNSNIHYFSCSNYVKDYRGTCPTRHYIRVEGVEQVVIRELARLAAYLEEDEEAFVELLAKKSGRMPKRRENCFRTNCKALLRGMRPLHGYLKSFMKTMLPAK